MVSCLSVECNGTWLSVYRSDGVVVNTHLNYRYLYKRIIDIVLSFFGLIILSPIFLFLIIILSVHFKKSPFFIQKRLGKNAEIFKIIKFKTMSDEKDDSGKLLPDYERTSTLGNFLRRTALDEIPQLFNVLNGEMSLIGPRPLLPYYKDLYNDFQKQRNEIKPGITGWAQINGRNNVPWKERFEMDVWYVENVSFSLDFKIMYKTFFQICKAQNSTNPNIPLDFEGN